jgi:hypothetical protein
MMVLDHSPVIPGPAEGRSPESRGGTRLAVWFWIPGSLANARAPE